MIFIKFFKDISKTDVQIAGGKGASLGEMTNSKFPVPAGFVVLAQAYEAFVQKIKPEITKLLKNLDVENTQKLDKTANEIQNLISKQKFPQDLKKEILESYKQLKYEFVAVRSSATTEDLPSASFAGQQATFLNVKGYKELINAVQDCWASLFTARAIYYRQTKDFDHMNALIAVVVQIMVDARAAGVAFSVNPIDNNKNDIVIEASFGLGEAVVSGQVTPDLYIVHKDNLKIHQKTVNEQTWGFYLDKKTKKTIKKNVPDPNAQVLFDKEIIAVANLVKKTEQHYECPQDTEFAVDEKGKIFLLQARPITTLTEVNSEQKQQFTLSYTRDRQIITQHAWFYGNSKGFEEITSVKVLNSPIIFHVNQGAIEIWEDEKAINFLKQEVDRINKTSEQFCIKIINEFRKNLEQFFKPYWEKQSILNKKELKKVADKFVQMAPYYVFMWYSIHSEKTSKKLKGELIKWRKDDAFFENTGKFIENSLEKIYPQLSKFKSLITIDEIETVPSANELEKRRLTHISIPGIFEKSISLEEFENSSNYIFLREKLIDTSILHGQVAYGGKVIGKVKIIRSRNQIREVSLGDILVSPMTIPEFLPAMKIAGAFVTDEGGMTCHAAIVARELKKPCIVGTKSATEILKDGDLVEVDANKGIIKKLKAK